MLIRKNTKAFKTILEIVTACRDRPDREQLIRLYITKAGDTVRDRISVEGIEGGAGLFYEMNYQAVMGNLKSSSHQLHESNEVAGVYFFHSSSNKVWDETPFEFDDAIKKEFGSLPQLPATRKKEKVEKITFPAPKVKTESGSARKPKKEGTKDTGDKKRSARVVEMWPKQPDYNLKREVHFTGLERIVLRQAQLTKKNVLDYYHKISEYLLPYLKDRPLMVSLYRDGQQRAVKMTREAFVQNSAEEVPEWIRMATVGKGKQHQEMLLCNDIEHLLYYVQAGGLEFHAGHSGVKSIDLPDYLVLVIESPDYELAKALEVALAVKDVLAGLRLPSFVKTDGASGLHVYVPLDSKSNFGVTRNVAEYLCNLVRLKIPDRVTVRRSQSESYGKVSLDYLTNEEGKGVQAPYSLLAQSGNVATPLLWEEVDKELKAEAFTHETIFKRLKEEGDPLKGLFRKKVDAQALLERLDEHYSFLF